MVLKYRVPWSELVSGFYDDVKSLTAGYASVDWAHGEYAPVDAVKVDVLLNGKPVDALCFVTHRGAALAEGRAVCKKLIGVISRQQFEVVVQAALGTKVFARERIAPYRKDVLIKSGKTVGGGDVSRKQKVRGGGRGAGARGRGARGASCPPLRLHWNAPSPPRRYLLTAAHTRPTPFPLFFLRAALAKAARGQEAHEDCG